MKLLWFLLSAAVMVQAWPLGIVNIVEKPKSKVTKEATKLLSEFFMREDGIQAYRMIRIGNRVKDGASAIASSVWQKDATKTTYSEDRVKRSTSTMVPNVCQEDAMKTTDSEVRANGSASTIAPSVSQEAGIKHADSGDRVEAGTELASRPERKTEMNSIDSQEEEEEIKHADSGHREEVTTEFASKPKQEATSNVIDIDVTKPLACELSINYYEVCDPETQSEPTCIDNWEYVSTLLLSLLRKV